MGEDEIRDQPTVRANLRLADRIDRYLGNVILSQSNEDVARDDARHHLPDPD